jgi:hypothetical protein
MRCPGLALLPALLAAPPALGQVPVAHRSVSVSSDSQMAALAALELHTRVRVHVRSVGRITGWWEGIRGDSVVMRPVATDQPFALADLDSAWSSTSASRTGALIGAVVGVGLSVWTDSRPCGALPSGGCASGRAAQDVVAIGVSAGMGAAIGAVVRHWKQRLPS